jgi:hypothetical protein
MTLCWVGVSVVGNVCWLRPAEPSVPHILARTMCRGGLSPMAPAEAAGIMVSLRDTARAASRRQERYAESPARKGRATGKGRERKLSCSRDNHRRRPFTRSCVSTDRRTSQHVLISLRTRETPRTDLERHMAMPGLYGVVTTSLLSHVRALLTAEAVSHLE